MIMAWMTIMLSMPSVAQQYSATTNIDGTNFTIIYNTDDKTAEICDLDYFHKIDDRKYPMSYGYRKLKGLRTRMLNVPEKIEIRNEEYTITSIGKAAFAGFMNVDRIMLPKTITNIDEYAFFRSSIIEMEIPDGVTHIGNRAFGYCKNLRKIVLPETARLNSQAYAESEDCKVEYFKGKTELAQQTTGKKSKPIIKTVAKSDVDLDIPSNPANNENMFAIIIANEVYQTEANVKYALSDGRTFKEYCEKVLGLPEDNIRYRENATLNNIIEDLDWAHKVAQAFDGQSRFIFYYAGHGIPDESTGVSYLLPVDGSGINIKTGFSLTELYNQLGKLPVQDVTVFMDACFSGSLRGDGMLASARAVAYKSKSEKPKGRMIVFSAAQGDETAHPFIEQGHGLFTYYLLKKLKETNGKVNLFDLGNYVKQQVKRKSIVANGKLQTPTISASANLGENWKSLKLK